MSQPDPRQWAPRRPARDFTTDPESVLERAVGYLWAVFTVGVAAAWVISLVAYYNTVS